MKGSVGQYRLSKDPREIYQTLEKVRGGKVLLWFQKDGVRLQGEAKFSALDSEKKRMSFSIETPLEGLQVGDICFLKTSKEDSVGKCEVLAISKKHVILKFPSEMVFREFRKHKRHLFRKSDSKQVQIQFQSNQTISGFGSPHWYEVLDASETGLSLFVDENEYERFEKKEAIRLVQVNQFKLLKPITGKVVRCISHIRKTDFGVDRGYKVALKLSEVIPSDTFQEFVFIERMLNLDPDKFFRDREFREKLHQTMLPTVQRLSQRLKLEDQLKLLEVKRDGNQYLRLHIELLVDVCCEVGRLLGWITEATTEKIVYCAYLHDVRYFENPKLAQIKNLKELEQKKHSLTPEEVAIYLEGPSYSAEIAEDDHAAAPDCQKILIQQKELPDGSGFPNQVRASQLAPLSCLFMVCHEFVDHVLEKEDWNMREFLSRAHVIYRGPYFSKILEVLEELGDNMQDKT